MTFLPSSATLDPSDLQPALARVDVRLLLGELVARPPRFERLAQLFELDAFEQEALLICLAPDVDLRYERLYAYLQDDVTRRRPSVDLVLRLLQPVGEARVDAREALGPGGRLQRRGLLTPVVPDDAAAQASLLAR